jgi:hypothetical protein
LGTKRSNYNALKSWEQEHKLAEILYVSSSGQQKISLIKKTGFFLGVEYFVTLL